MTYDAVPLIPRSVLFGNPTYASPAVSPDGTRLGYLAPSDGVLNVWVGPVDEPVKASAVTHDRGRGIRTFGFCHDDRTLYYLQDEGGDENWRLHLLDLETGEEECVTPFESVKVDVIGHNRWNPTAMLLSMNKDNPELFDVWRLDLATRSLEKAYENPGDLVGYLVDTDYQVRGATSMTEDGGSLLYLRDGDTGELRLWKEVSAEDASGTGTLGFTRDGTTLFYLSSIDANASRLLAVDIATREESVVAADEAYDIGAVELDPATRRPQAVVFDKDREEWSYLDADFQTEVDRLRTALATAGAPDGDLTLSRSERGDRIWQISLVPSDNAVHYYLYDRENDALTFLFVHKPDLAEYALAPMEPFTFTARDGLTIHGYVTYPLGVSHSKLPAVLNVHGGPWHRDSWGYHPEAQWLANRGYACIQVNFRGSTGYGKAFLNAGDKQWARSMHTDLLDAIDHLVAQGVVDEQRIGIMGGSYGGYAALVGAAFTPDIFRCAVDLCGPSNLLTLLASIPPYWKPLRAVFTSKMGDPDIEKDDLWGRSPLSRVDDITIPVLVAQGKNDPRVKEAEAEQIVKALAEKGLPHEYLLFPDEGHGLARPENRMTYYTAVERFLAEHLDGRAEPTAS